MRRSIQGIRFLVKTVLAKVYYRPMAYQIYPLKLYIRKIPVLLMAGMSIVLNLISWLWLAFHIRRSAEQVFLHYNILFGVDQIGEPSQVYRIPLAAMILLVINSVSSWILYRKDWFFSYFLLAITVIVTTFALISSILIVSLNI